MAITQDSRTTLNSFDLERERQMIEPKKKLIDIASGIIRKPFVIDNTNREVIQALFMYFTHDQEFEQSGICANPSLRKGLMIYGEVGTGKTVILKSFCKMFRVKFITAREVSRAFMVEGWDAIDRFGLKSYYQGKPIHTAFDDLGFEQDCNLYGNKVNVMAEILTDRYEKWRDADMRTFATTNMDAESIAEAYGDKVKSRIREMFNYIPLTGEDRRK